MSTIKEVAQRAGLSVSCVSKYLNHPNNVLPETKEKIDEAIVALNYKPSFIARSLRTKRTGIVVVVMESIINPFFAELYDHLHREFEKSGYKTFLYTLSGQSFTTDDFSYADRIVICFPDDDTVISQIESVSAGIPKILLHGHKVSGNFLGIYCDVGSGSFSAVEYLYKKNCRHFLLVSGASKSSMTNEKTNAIKKYLKSAKEKTTCVSHYGSNDFAGGENAVNSFCDSLNTLDAIICESDALATGVISRLLSLDIDIPNKIKVIGYDNIPISEMYRPSITTVSIPIKEMCEEAAKNLEKTSDSDSVYKPTLLIRKTT